MSMRTLTWDVDTAAIVAGNSDAYGLALATQARQKKLMSDTFFLLSSKKFSSTFILWVGGSPTWPTSVVTSKKACVRIATTKAETATRPNINHTSSKFLQIRPLMEIGPLKGRGGDGCVQARHQVWPDNEVRGGGASIVCGHNVLPPPPPSPLSKLNVAPRLGVFNRQCITNNKCGI